MDTDISQDRIAEIIEVSPSTISRELKRNKDKRGYRNKQAQEKVFCILSERYRNRCKRFGLRFNLIAAFYNFELQAVS